MGVQSDLLEEGVFLEDGAFLDDGILLLVALLGPISLFDAYDWFLKLVI